MRVALLVLLSTTVATAPVVPALACVQTPASGCRTEPKEESCCCRANALTCMCGCCDDDTSESDDAPRAEQACLCSQTTPQNHEQPRAEAGGAEVRLATFVSTARSEGQQRRRITATVEIPRRCPHPEVRPPLLI